MQSVALIICLHAYKDENTSDENMKETRGFIVFVFLIKLVSRGL